MDLYDYLLWLVFWIMGAVYGWYARERHAKRHIERIYSEVQEIVGETINENLIPITIEKHKGGFFVYNKDTSEFMGQGQTRRQLEDTLAKRFPDKRFAASTENLKVFNEPF